MPARDGGNGDEGLALRGAGTGGYASVEANARLLAKLADYPDPGVGALAAQEMLVFAKRIEELKQSEAVRDRSESDRFE